MSDGKIEYKVTADNSGISSDLDDTTSIINKKTSGWASAAKTATVAIGASITALAAVGTQIYDYGSEFEQTIANASTLFGDTQVDVENLNDKILDLSNSTGIAASEIGTSLYNALSAGIPATEDMGEAVSFLESSASLAVAGFTDIDTAVSTTAKILNAYQMDVSETDKVQKILMQTQNNGITTVGELGASLAQVTPTAAAMGVTFDQVGAALATMTAQGTPTAQATTQLNSLFAELGKSGTTAQKALAEAAKGTEYAGMSFQDMMDAGVPLNDVLNMMDGYAEDNGKSLLDMFSSIEAGKAALAMAGENSDSFTKNLEAMATEADVVGEAFEDVSSTSAYTMNEMLNELKNTAIALYNDLAPMVTELIPMLSDALQEVLPILAQVIVDILPQIISLIEELLPIIVQVLQDLLPPLIDILMALIVPLMDIIEAVLPPLASLLAALAPLLTMIAELLTPIIELFGSLLGPIVEVITSALTPLIDIISEIIDAVFPALETALTFLSDTFSSIFTGIADTVSGVFDGLKEAFGGLIDFITGIFTGNWEKAWNGIKDIFGGVFTAIKELFKTPINWIIDGINVFIRGLNLLKIPDWVPVVGGLGLNIAEIPRLAKGGTITAEGTAMVGEEGPELLTLPTGASVSPLTGSNAASSSGTAIDYDALASAIWAKAPAMGGDVYMDSTKVGKMVTDTVSKTQADNLTSLQRSGYRGTT